MDDRATRWDRHFAGATFDPGSHDDWVTPHLEGLPACAILELGCGLGFLSEMLHRRGHSVLATDFSRAALERLQARVGNLPTRCLDLRQPLPFERGVFHVVIADLCLHYFDRTTTAGVLREIARILESDGLLLCRLNSSTDFEHGAGQGRLLEPGFYERGGHCKRFFDEPMVRSFLSDWSIRSCANYDSRYSGRTKNLWEIVAAPGGGP